VVRLDDLHTRLGRDGRCGNGAGLADLQLERRFANIVIHLQSQGLQTLDDLMNVFGHPRNRLVLMHHALEAKRPDGTTG